ncbi:MAG: undecaprenyl-diphosphate phosphatase [Actinomycetota bacterium]|nr:undecaprenyl-diphosphate phosphatase [Actinomycetota bacterium]
MPILHAIVLGLVQGLSEFLPISSSAHLEVVPWLLGWDDFAARPDLETTFDVALHVGTFVGAVAYFRHDVVRLARGGVNALRARRVATEVAVSEVSVPPARGASTGPEEPDDGRLAWLLIASSVPAALVGGLFEEVFAGIGETKWLVGVLLAGFGLVLLWADRLGGDRGAEDFSMRDALTMGVAQALALQPGVSRSGVTITAARRLGFRREAAARLSFLMSLPVIAGAALYKGLDLLVAGGIPAGFGGAFAWGVATSAITGWAAVWGTLRLVRTRTFTPFVIYRALAGAAIVAVAITGWR